MLHTKIALALGLMFSSVSMSTHAAEQLDANGTSMTTRTSNRTIKTDEKRWSSPEGNTQGTFDQLVKGNGTPEDLKQTGPYTKDDDKEVYNLRETGVTQIGKRVDNGLVITRDLVGGLLQEVLKRTPKQKAETKEQEIELLGGLPGIVNTQYKADGSRFVQIWNDPHAGPHTPPDDTYNDTVDTGGGRTPPGGGLDGFIRGYVKVKDTGNTPPDDGKDPIKTPGLDLDKITVINVAPPTGPGTPPVVTPPVAPVNPPTNPFTGSRTGP